MRVFVTGGTGLVGPRLIRRLVGRGDQVSLLSRRPDAWQRVGQDVAVTTGDPTQPGDWQANVANCDAVVHLAGAGIFDQRWTDAYKQTIRDSRIRSTDNIVAAMKQSGGATRVLISASAIGYYGAHGDEAVTEETGPGTDFMAQVCVDWESAARAAEADGARVAIIRTGVVHDLASGALKQLLLPFKLGVGGPVGMALNPANWGRQYWSWIHYADLVGIYLLALDRADASGPINGTAPNPVTNKQFAKAFGQVLGRPAVAPLPAFALRLMLGQVADVVTTGQRVIPKRALALGYDFQYPELLPALRDLLSERN